MIFAAMLTGALSCTAPHPLPIVERTAAMVEYGLPHNRKDVGEDMYGAIDQARVDANGDLWILFTHDQRMGVIRRGRLRICAVQPARAKWISAGAHPLRHAAGNFTAKTLSVPYARGSVVVTFAKAYGKASPIHVFPDERLVGYAPAGASPIFAYEDPTGQVWLNFEYIGKDGNITGAGSLARISSRGTYRIFHVAPQEHAPVGDMSMDNRRRLWVHTSMCECVWRIDTRKL